MSNVSQWSTTAASNNASPPDGWPENMARASVNDSAREMMAALSKWFLDTDGSLVSAGGTTAYTLTTNSSNAALADISFLIFRINATNTGAATLAVDGLTAKDWTKPGGTALSAGDIVANQMVATIYNPNDDRFELLGAAPALNLNGLTTETAIATGDLLAFVDVSDSNGSEKITVANFLNIINGLTQGTTVDTDADFLVMYDASESAVRKVDLDVINNVAVLNKQTASSSSELDFTLDTSKYDYFEIELRNLLPATDGAGFDVLFKDDGDGAFSTGASDYSWARSGVIAGVGAVNTNGNTDASIELTAESASSGVANDGDGVSGVIRIYSANATKQTNIIASINYNPGTPSGSDAILNASGHRLVDEKSEEVRIAFTTGNIASGDAILRGFRDPR